MWPKTKIKNDNRSCARQSRRPQKNGPSPSPRPPPFPVQCTSPPTIARLSHPLMPQQTNITLRHSIFRSFSPHSPTMVRYALHRLRTRSYALSRSPVCAHRGQWGCRAGCSQALRRLVRLVLCSRVGADDHALRSCRAMGLCHAQEGQEGSPWVSASDQRVYWPERAGRLSRW